MGTLGAAVARKWPASVRLSLAEIVALRLAAQPGRRHDPDLESGLRKLRAVERRRVRAVSRAAR